MRAALGVLNGEGVHDLEFFVLTADEETPARVAGHLRDILGRPSEDNGETLS